MSKSVLFLVLIFKGTFYGYQIMNKNHHIVKMMCDRLLHRANLPELPNS